MVTAWCREHIAEPTLPQRLALPLGIARKDHLIVSPTGTGKTLAAFLPAISRLAHARDGDVLFPRTNIIYISPLRALGYDIEYNVRRPLREMEFLERPNSPRPELRRGRLRERVVRTGVRTGDTPVEERRLMLARPPHILMTTPESLALLLALTSYRKTLALVDTVIVDEVHALAASKRGAQLSLVLESLAELTGPRGFTRVGLSATVAPLERVAEFLCGPGRPCEIVDARGLRAMHFAIEAVTPGVFATMPAIAAAALAHTREDGTSLVFTNVRSQAERLAHEMEQAALHEAAEITFAAELPPKERRNARIGVHHSALERSVRHSLEARLRKGELRTVVCSASLELGVDIGYIDRVILIGGARGMTSTLQRVGRSGHRPGAVAHGIILAQDRDDLIEAAATIHAIGQLAIDEITLPRAPLDVLAQWVVSCVVPDRRIEVCELFSIARRAAPFAELSESDLRACIAYLSGGGAGGEEAGVRRIGLEGETVVGLGRDVSAAFYENSGTIPDEQGVNVRSQGDLLGRLDESFVSSLHEGDVFILSGRTMRVKEIRDAEVRVEPFSGRPTVPVWSSHLKGISPQLAAEIGLVRRGIAERLDDGMAVPWLERVYGMHRIEAEIMAEYVAQQAALSAVPDGRACVIECYMMDGKPGTVFHTCAGRRVNEALARAVAARIQRRRDCDIRITTDDAGFLVALDAREGFTDAEWSALIDPRDFESDLRAGLRASHLLRRHFRFIANTGLLVLRRAAGRKLSGRNRWQAGAIFDRLIAADPDFPLVRETFRTVCRDILDAEGARRYLERQAAPIVVHPPAATPFTFGILSSSFADTVQSADRETVIEALHARVLELTKSPKR